MPHTLEQLGWLQMALPQQPTENLGRVVTALRHQCEIETTRGVEPAKVSGKFRHETKKAADFPTVGDWVVLQKEKGKSVIQSLIPRRTTLMRQAAGERPELQVFAANIDRVFVVSSLNQDLSLRRLERYLLSIRQGGAEPVILLSKADLKSNAEEKIQEVTAVAQGARVLAIAAKTGHGIDTFLSLLAPGLTGVLVGSSGVGKSTLINKILGNESIKTREVRASDEQGRHTTASRALFHLPSGGMLIDTPGVREFALPDEELDFDGLFPEIASLALQCKFTNCTHVTEPGCKIKNAIESGAIDQKRFESFAKLRSENQKRWRR